MIFMRKFSWDVPLINIQHSAYSNNQRSSLFMRKFQSFRNNTIIIFDHRHGANGA